MWLLSLAEERKEGENSKDTVSPTDQSSAKSRLCRHYPLSPPGPVIMKHTQQNKSVDETLSSEMVL